MNDDQASDMLQQNEEQSRQPEVTKSSTSTPRTEEMEMKQQLSSPRSAALNQQLEQRYAKSLAQSNGATLDLSALGLKELPSLDELGRRFPKLRQLNLPSVVCDLLSASISLKISFESFLPQRLSISTLWKKLMCVPT
ncbi:hypothetical protein PHYBOEH_009995 [Phytophthora boehmeriae]|uniref:Uncharacterized protein n=1 Tax=Phytophthora boehmeriae TaxID=109152 RepID=A0A8T1WY51_9STRA|nr:hypothetical protein PHYBOEH_009995 [Phytophthora boehmeriae]